MNRFQIKQFIEEINEDDLEYINCLIKFRLNEVLERNKKALEFCIDSYSTPSQDSIDKIIEFYAKGDR